MNPFTIYLVFAALILGFAYFVWLLRNYPGSRSVEVSNSELAHDPAIQQRILPLLRRELFSVALTLLILATLCVSLISESFFEMNVVPAKSVQAMDLAGEPSEIQIPDEGLSTFQAIQRMSAPTNGTKTSDGEAADDEEEPWFLMIRPLGNDCTYYLPESFVVNGEASHFKLNPQDQIRWVKLEKTRLGVLEPPKVGANFSVSGMIESPGTFAVKEDADTLMSIATPEYARSFSVGPDGPNVLILRRKNDQSQLGEVYLMPLVEPYLDMFLLESYLAEGDSLEYARIQKPQDWWKNYREALENGLDK